MSEKTAIASSAAWETLLDEKEEVEGMPKKTCPTVAPGQTGQGLAVGWAGRVFEAAEIMGHGPEPGTSP